MADISRRKFIKGSTAMAISASMFLVGCGGGGTSTSKPVNTTPNNNNNNNNPVTSNPNKNLNKSLVYVLLGGGNDSFNMLVPTNTSSYNEYNASRSNLAIAKNDLLPLNNFTDKNGKTFGLHPSMKKVQTLFNDKKLSFIANIAPLVEPTNKTQFNSNSVELPLGLMSHSDQTKHWQTSNANERTNIGVLGRFADTFQINKANSQVSMNISLSGTNISQNGVSSKEYSITKDGSIGLKVKESSNNPAITQLNNALLDSFNTILNQNYSDSFEDTFMETTRYAQTHHEKFKTAIDKINITHNFTSYDSRNDIKFTANDKSISQQFKMIAKAIKASEDLNLPKQTFFIEYYGWDHHDELLNNHKRMIEVLSDSLGDFQTSLEELGVDDKVLTVVGSDFGRTLTSNGNGTDHGWGGNAIVMGKDVNGGKVFGEYPSLVLNNPLDIGGGVIIPTLSTDELFAEVALWFGIEKNELSKLLPNLTNFYSLNNPNNPIGFLS